MLREAREEKLGESFGEVLCRLVVECGVDDQRALDMPYLRGIALVEYLRKRTKAEKDAMDKNRRGKTFGGM